MRRIAIAAVSVLFGCTGVADVDETQIALIHIGDIHGHMVARPNVRSDSSGPMEGGLARMYTKIEELRAKHRHHVLANTGDTIQGSAEAMYTRGQALVDVLNAFGIDVFTPGNWEFVYGTQRFLVLLSEMGVANNFRLAEKIAGIDVILSSDMHEVTREPALSKNGTLIVEEGQDGTVVGELVLTLKAGKVARWSWKSHTIDDRIAESGRIAAMVARERETFVSGPKFKAHVNPFNGTQLARPIDTVVGRTRVALHRSNFSGASMPAVIEGTAHDFLTDAFRAQTNADVGAIRRFRYGTHVPPGPIRMEDLYHFIPIGPAIAKGKVKGRQLRNQIEASADGSLNPDVAQWTGGWLFNFSALTLTLDPYAASGQRASAIRVYDRNSGSFKPLDPEADYTYASYHYRADPNLINVVEARDIEVLQGADGRPLDGVEVVVRYLESLPERTANPEPNRIKLARPLPPPAFGSPEVQPRRGARP